MFLPKFAHLLPLFIAFCASSLPIHAHSKGTSCTIDATSGFNYDIFYRISDYTARHKWGISFEFRVKTPSDAHIKFSENNFSSKDAPAYEVVIGAGKNTFSFIRRKEVDLSKVRLDTPEFLSSEEARGFWIRITNDGIIQVGKEGEVLPFMSWKDDDPLNINYFSFSSWHGISAEWYFKCSDFQGLYEKYLGSLGNYLFGSGIGDAVYEPPINTGVSNFTKVLTHLSCRYIQLDDRRSILVVNGVLSMLWEDKRNIWSPKEFKNQQYLDWPSYAIWTPRVILHNAVDNEVNYKTKSNSNVRIYSNGTVLWKYPVYYSAFCNGIDYHDWPMDTHVCELQLELIPPHSTLQMVLLREGIHLQDSMVNSGWSIAKVAAMTKRMPFNERAYKHLDTIKSSGPDQILFQITLNRSHSIYYTVLLLSLAAISMLMLTSFWASPLGSVKIGLQFISLGMTSMSLLFCWRMIPAQNYRNLPAIYLAFIVTMYMEWIAILSSVTTSRFIFSSPARIPHSVGSFLKSKFLTIFLCLPQPSNKVAARYNQLNGGSPMNKEDSHGYSFISNESESQWNWILIAIVTERIFFCVYTALFSYLMSTCIHIC